MSNSSFSSVLIAALFASSILLGLMVTPKSISADELSGTNFTAEQFAEFEQQLNSLLRTRRQEERAFIAGVVQQVRLGRIPSRLISTSFGWVRTKRPGTKYPFIYFEKVLRLQAQAANLGDEIPAFDLAIYESPGQNPVRVQNSAGIRPFLDRNVAPSAGQR